MERNNFLESDSRNFIKRRGGMKTILVVLTTVMVMFSATVCFAGDIKIIKKDVYDLTLESKEIKAGSSIIEYFDIDTIGAKIPDQIFAIAETGDWLLSLPWMVYVVSSADNTVDKITEYWEVSFANVKDGRVVFNRIITNNDSVDRESYAWNLQVKCRYVTYK